MGNSQTIRRSRRSFLSASVPAAATVSLLGCGSTEPPAPPPETARRRRSPTLLLRSGWQTVNIGDIAHTPGVLRLLRQYYPKFKIIVWSNALDRGVKEMLFANFPGIRIVSGGVTENGEPDSDELRRAFGMSDFLLHGSGPSVVARNHLAAWKRQTGKPYGILGVTIALQNEAARPMLEPELKQLLEGAAFVYTRETKSLENLKQAGVEGPVLGFAPDGTFSLKLFSEDAAKEYMAAAKLEPKKFIAVVPRLRYTPYHKFREVNWSDAEIRRRTSANEAHAEPDHAKLREVIIAWVRETGNKVLLCPEMTYQVDIIDPLLYDPLPADVKRQVVRRKEYWLTDLASSVYRRASIVISYECHSPIIAAVNDTPCIYIHQPEDGIKGQMWQDVGLRQYYFEAGEVTGEKITGRLQEIQHYYASAQVDVHEAVVYARKLQGDAMTVLGQVLA